MSWSVADGTQLMAVSTFVFWEPYNFSKSMRKEYESKRANLRMFPGVPAQAFPIIWYLLKVCLVAATVLFFHYTADVNHWCWPTVFGLLFGNLALAKTWTFFYRQRMYGVALGVAVALFATALAILICIGVGKDNLGGLWYVPLILYVPYTVWLLFACFLSYSLMDMPHSSSRSGSRRDEMEPLLPQPSSQMQQSQIVLSRKIAHSIQKGQ